MNKATLDDLINDLEDIAKKKETKIEFNLHEGIHRLIDGFVNEDKAIAFLKEYQSTRQRTI